MKSFLIGIAGGSGSGKTALAYALRRALGRKAAVLHLDDYQRFGQKLPLRYGMKNWDHPRAVEWRELYRDLFALAKGKPVVLEVRDQKRLRVNESPKMVSFKPMKIIIVEGYLLFHKPEIRKIFDLRVFLQAKHPIRMQRRTKFKNRDYIEKVLLPMHDRYVEPTKRYAELVLSTDRLSVVQCVRRIVGMLPTGKA